MKRMPVYFMLMLFLIIIMAMSNGCSSSGSDDVAYDGPDTAVVGFKYTEENMTEAAIVGIDPLLFFPNLSRIIGFLIDTVEAKGVPDAGTILLSAALCQGLGTANFEWFSVRDQGTMDLVVENCHISSGAVTGAINFDNVLYEPVEEENDSLAAKIQIGLEITEQYGSGTAVQHIDGKFLLRMLRAPNEISKLQFRYGGRDVDPGAWFEMTERDKQMLMGCFDVSVSFDPENDEGSFTIGDYTISQTFGMIVFNNQLMEISGRPGRGNIADFEFQGFAPVSGGGMDYWGFVRGDGCAAVGVPDGVGQPERATMSLYPIGAEMIRLDLYPNSFNSSIGKSIDMLWSDLVD